MDKNKLFWHSRRGMLELDLLLLPFLEQCFDELGIGEQEIYEQLLKSEDQDLFAWLMAAKNSDQHAFSSLVPLQFHEIIRRIVAHSTV